MNALKRALQTPNSATLLVLALTLAHGLIWRALTPAWAAPDEPGHYLYARLLADLGRIPARADLDAAVEAPLLDSLSEHDWWGYNGRPEPARPPARLTDDPVLAASGAQIEDEPPLFYSLPALFLKIIPHSRQNPAVLLRWLRLWPLILRLAVAGLALLLARSLWPNRPDRQFSLGLLAGTLPMVGFIGGSFNNDALALAWGALSFLLLALPDRGLITLLVLAAGPIFIDRSLLFYWPVALIWLPASGEELKPHRRTLALALVLVLGLLLTPNPRWAGGWQRFPALAATRDADLGLRLHDARPDYRARIVQIISGKRVLSLRDQTVMLEATFRGDPGAPLHLRLADSVHAADTLCPAAVEPAVCRLPLTIHPHASQLRLLAAVGERGDPAATGDISLRLRLLAPDGEDLLFNGDASQPAPLGSPIFTGIEALLPLASGYFDQALTPAAWDAPAQFRYALFAGFTWVSFWGYFGWLSRPLPWLVYALPAGFSLLAGWGLFRGMMAALARQKRGQIRPEERVLALALLAVGLVLLQIWAPMLGQAWQPQGRYLFPALLPIVFLLLLGAETALPPRWRVRLPGLLFGGLLVLNGVSWLVTAR